MVVATPDTDPNRLEELHRLLVEQLADYQAMLHLAQEEALTLAAQRFEALHHTQAQRERLAQHILARQQTLPPIGTAQQPFLQTVLADIAATIEAILTLDQQHQCRIEAERDAVAILLQQLQQGRTVLHQYRPWQENLPHFLNRTI
jgi:hypothetical protein